MIKTNKARRSINCGIIPVGLTSQIVSRLCVFFGCSDETRWLPSVREGDAAVHWKCCESYPKLSNLHEITQFCLDIMLTCLHFWSISYKKNNVVFCQKLQIENVPCTNPMALGIHECCPFFKCRRWGKCSWRNSPDHENLLQGSCIARWAWVSAPIASLNHAKMPVFRILSKLSVFLCFRPSKKKKNVNFIFRVFWTFGQC